MKEKLLLAVGCRDSQLSGGLPCPDSPWFAQLETILLIPPIPPDYASMMCVLTRQMDLYWFIAIICALAGHCARHRLR